MRGWDLRRDELGKSITRKGFWQRADDLWHCARTQSLQSDARKRRRLLTEAGTAVTFNRRVRWSPLTGFSTRFSSRMAARAWQKAPGVVQILGLGVVLVGVVVVLPQLGRKMVCRPLWDVVGAGQRTRSRDLSWRRGAQSAANMRSDHRVSSFPSSC